MKYNPKYHHRRSIRLKGYDYAQAGCYFITLCVENRISLFGDIIGGDLKLNSLGQIAQKEWEKTAQIRKNCSLGAFIIMPNHFHAILSIDYPITETGEINTFRSPSHTIGAIIRGYKGSTTKKIKAAIRRRAGEQQFAPTRDQAAPKKEIFPSIDLSKSIWQRNYYEHIIRTEQAYQNIENYIINNPKNWIGDKFHR